MLPEGKEKLSPAAVRRLLGGSGDLNERTLSLGGPGGPRAALFYIEGLVSGESVAREVIFPAGDPARFPRCGTTARAVAAIEGGAVFCGGVRRRESLEDVAQDLLAGFCALVFDGLALCFETKSTQQRSVEAPTVEKSVKGPKEAFTENYRVNTALLRRRLRDPALRLEERSLGRRSGTRVGLCYLEGAADPRVVEQARARLGQIDVEAVLSSGSVEELAAGSRRSPFPQVLTTERPDKLALGLLEGRVALLVEGLPMGFLLPTDISEFFRVPEDDSIHYLAASFLTLLRYGAVFISVFLPAVYVAVAVYHRQMIPVKLLLSIIASRQDVPFSTAAEVLGMLLTFELLQEAGLRLPQTVGQTVSIIGGLVVGQAAVEAKVVSPVVVIVVALAGIAGFTIPNHDMSLALRLCRLGAAVLSFCFGLYGIMLGLALLLCHLASLETFGVAYTQPFTGGGGLRALIKPPVSANRRRKPYLTPGRESEPE